MTDAPAPTRRLTAEELLRLERDLAVTLGATSNQEAALAAILDAALQVESVDSGGVYLFDADGSLHLTAHRGLSAAFVAFASHFSPDAPHVAFVRAGKAVFAPYERIRLSENPAQLDEGLHATAIIPVCHEGETVAVLNAATHIADDFTEPARAALVSIASRIGGALARVRAQEETRATEENFQGLFDSLHDFLFVLDDAGCIVHVNRVVVDRLGYSAEELSGMHVLGVHPEPRRDEAQRIIGEMLAGRLAYCPVPLQARGGEQIPVETVVSHGRWRGRPALIGVSRDITRRARAEEALAKLNADLEQRVADRTVELLQASRAKDDFLAGMSHELRTPLNGILGLCEALQEGVYGPIPEKQKVPLTRIDECGSHLLSLITDILDIAKIDAGAMSLDLSPVVLDDICHAALRMVQDAAQRKRHQIGLRIELREHRIVADARRLKQILVNLLSNAVKFTPTQGHIQLHVEDLDDGVRLVVADDGIGVPADQIDKLFQPFVQLDTRLSREFSGTGLGLTLVRRFAEMHGGSVGVESKPGAGSRFSVVLPRGDMPHA